MVTTIDCGRAKLKNQSGGEFLLALTCVQQERGLKKKNGFLAQGKQKEIFKAFFFGACRIVYQWNEETLEILNGWLGAQMDARALLGSSQKLNSPESSRPTKVSSRGFPQSRLLVPQTSSTAEQ